MNHCEISISAIVGSGFSRYLRKYLPSIIELACPHLESLSLVLADDALIKDLHTQYFNDSSTTDVITFPLDVNNKGQTTSGEIYICVPEMLRQARLRRLLRHRDELLLYTVHGCLHLGGYNDLTSSDFLAMHKREDQILSALGIGAARASDPNAKPDFPTRPIRRKRKAVHH